MQADGILSGGVRDDEIGTADERAVIQGNGFEQFTARPPSQTDVSVFVADRAIGKSRTVAVKPRQTR